MFDESETLESPTGAALNLHVKRATAEPRGILLVQHGLAEHSARYATFAAWMAERGLHVFAHDHRGHGRTRAPDAPPRRFAARNGPEAVLADSAAVHALASARHPGLPVVVFGHSMGGLIALNYVQRHAGACAGLCVWNVDAVPNIALQLGRLALRAERALKGSDVASSIMPRATFDRWAGAFEPRRTAYDWLSSDPAAVDAYVADPLCGFSPTIVMWTDILSLIREGGAFAGLRRLPGGLPVHCLGGAGDPVTDGGDALSVLARRLERAGLRDVTFDRIDGARHETLHEASRIRSAALARLDAFLAKALGEPSAPASDG